MSKRRPLFICMNCNLRILIIDIKRDAMRHPLNSTGLKEALNTTLLNNNIFKKFVKRFLKKN